jgi:hypothetical protein
VTQSMRILVACLLIAVPCAVGPVRVAAASPAVIAQADRGETHLAGTVAGTVRDNTGAPIAGAVVTLSGPRSYTTTTDAAGRFTISDVRPAFYNLTVTKPGYDTAQEADLAVFAGETANLVVSMHLATLTSLRTIATVHAAGQGVFNTSTASVNVVTSQTFIDQGQTQVTRILNQIPGVQISLPQSSANGAVPGAITFPNIRGALSFETASLIDGHPLSVGTYGDYVTTFLNPFMLGDVEVIKGPGAMAPEVNYAIGGTVNFRTKSPTYEPTPQYRFGVDSHGGTIADLGFSDTLGRLGFVLAFANDDQPSAIKQYPANFYPSYGSVTVGGRTVGFGASYTASSGALIPGTVSGINTNYTLFACCFAVNGEYQNQSELVKLQYKLSPATVVTASYLGSQSYANQSGNTSAMQPVAFTPPAGYIGPYPAGPLQLLSVFPYAPTLEVNNEPIFQAEVHTLLGKDTILARFYHASIDRLVGQGQDNPAVPDIGFAQLFGGYTTQSGTYIFNGQSYPITFFDYYRQEELDKLAGLSFEYDHPIHDNELSFAVDTTNSQTTNGTTGGGPYTGSVPTGSGQIFTTLLERGRFQVRPKLSATVSLYENSYKSTVPSICYKPGSPGTPATCYSDGSNAIFTTATTTHFDQRLGIEYRPSADTAVRFAVGSAIAPPYLALLSVPTGSISFKQTYATQTVNSAGLKPETAFGYDLGADHRFKDGVTIVSADLYLTNLFNHFIQQTYYSGLTCSTSPCTSPVPLYYTSNVNLNNARFEGIELSLHRTPDYGFGYALAGAVQRGYAYNLPPNFYCSNPTVPCTPANYNTNLAIIAGNNFTGYGIGPYFGEPIYGGDSFNGFSNQNIPYLQGNVEISYRWRNGIYVAFGDTLYGKNNSLNEPPFAIAYATLRLPLTQKLALQVSGDNIFNTYSGLFPIVGGGVPIPLANGTQAATTANVLGPATYRFVIVQRL